MPDYNKLAQWVECWTGCNKLAQWVECWTGVPGYNKLAQWVECWTGVRVVVTIKCMSTWSARRLKKNEIRDKCRAVSTHELHWTSSICLLFSGFSNVCHSACVWCTAVKLGLISNFDTFFLVMWLTFLVGEIKCMLISSRHFCIRSSVKNVAVGETCGNTPCTWHEEIVAACL